MRRHELSDEQWVIVRDLIPARRGRHSKRGDRDFINAVLYLAKTGCPWRDLPERYGKWKTVYNRFSNWAKSGLWECIFKALQVDVDPAGSIMDASIVRAHQDAAGGKGGPDAMLWAVLEEAFRPKSTPSRTFRASRSTSSSRLGSSTRRRSPRT